VINEKIKDEVTEINSKYFIQQIVVPHL